MKAVYEISVVPASEKAAGILANVRIADDRGNKWTLGIFKNSGDIKMRDWSMEINPSLALVLVSIKPKLKPGYSVQLTIHHGDNGVKWTVADEKNSEVNAVNSIAVNSIIENAEEAFK